MNISRQDEGVRPHGSNKDWTKGLRIHKCNTCGKEFESFVSYNKTGRQLDKVCGEPRCYFAQFEITTTTPERRLLTFF